MGYGTSPLIVALAIQSAGSVGSPFGNSIGILFVSYLAASIAVIVMVTLSGGRQTITSIPRDGFNWYLFS
ncbi:MAG: hypothetical protein VW907_09660, partial [Opitutae bacterium]